MKHIFLLAALVFWSLATQAQLLTPANGGSAKATAGERIGITDVTISYGRPAVRGREGRIWGQLVYEGFQDQGFGNGNPAPWRAGANENTVIEFSTDVLVEGHQLKAGRYGFFVAYSPASCTLIFSANTTSWGKLFYEEKEDVLRVNVKPVAVAESRERLTYEFGSETDSSAVISLIWEKLSIPFTVTTQLHQLQVACFDREMRGEKGFDANNLIQVADYYQEHDMRLDEALRYIENAAASMPTFTVYMTKAQILEKMHHQPRADSMVREAVARGSARQVHNFARTLLAQDQKQKAFSIFKLNYEHYPNTFTTNMGMARGYAAIGKPKDALRYAAQALPQAPNEPNKKAVEEMISKLKEGKAI